MKNGSSLAAGLECVHGAGTSMAAAETKERHAAWIQPLIHDLCQPLMALDCLLSVNREAVPGESLDASLLRTVMEEGLVECGRMIALIRAIEERTSLMVELANE